MKRFFAVLFAVVFIMSCKQENAKKTIDPKDSETFDLVGNIKNVTEEMSVYEDSTGKMVQKYIELVFDENQKIIAKKTMNASKELLEEIGYDGLNQMIYKKQFHLNEVVFETQYQWNSRKQLTLEIKKNEVDAIVEKTEFQYELGFLVKEIYQNFASKNNSTTTFERDEKGNIQEEIYENPTGKIKSKKKYVYDEKNNKIQETQIDQNGQEIYQLTIAYNEENLPISEKYVDANGTLLQQYLKEYDRNQNIVKTVSVQGEIETVVENYIHDTNNKLLEYESIVNGEKIQTVTYTYDDKGNEIEIVEKTNQDQMVTQFQYEYDVKGNWILKKVTQPNGKKLEFARTLDYY